MYDSRWKSRFRKRLLKWFDVHKRDLPWRHRSTRYRVWVSEIMLQQTQVATVVDYYNRFMQRFPELEDLAKAEQAEVLKLWEGLGYYRRARQMHEAAQIVLDDFGGRFPDDFESALSLPGIGRYTAGAILSIADDQKLPVLEGNTIRLYSRLIELRENPRTTPNQRLLWEFAGEILPNKRCGDFNQALMELGARVCKPKNPFCDSCPVKSQCPTYIKGLQKIIPASSKPLKYEDLNEAVTVVARRGRFLVRQCGEGERWTGLWDFPRFVVSGKRATGQLEKQLKKLTGLNVELEATDLQIKHAVTRFRITLDCFRSASVSGRLKSSAGEAFQWADLETLKGLPMSVTGRKVADQLKKEL
ncbi:MAG: A/G-specific adenine glycosylase [Planctomycetota bacterium]